MILALTLNKTNKSYNSFNIVFEGQICVPNLWPVLSIIVITSQQLICVFTPLLNPLFTAPCYLRWRGLVKEAHFSVGLNT